MHRDQDTLQNMEFSTRSEVHITRGRALWALVINIIASIACCVWLLLSSNHNTASLFRMNFRPRRISWRSFLLQESTSCLVADFLAPGLPGFPLYLPPLAHAIVKIQHSTGWHVIRGSPL